MTEKIIANMRANFLYFYRSGGLPMLLILAVFMFFTCWSLLGELIFSVSIDIEEIVRSSIDTFHALMYIAPIFGSACLLFFFNSHFRDRNTKMLMVRPCPSLMLGCL